MTVYVDDAFIEASVPYRGKKLTSRWCHMMADSREELIAFGLAMGLKQQWLQNKRSGVHFDLTEPRRRKALKLGAVEIKTRTPEWLAAVASARAQYQSDRPLP